MDVTRMLHLALLLGLMVVAGSGLAQDAEPASEADMSVASMAFGTGYVYETHMLEGEATTFPADVAVVWCQTRIVGADEPTMVTHVWYRDGKTMARVELSVASPSYRTVSSKKIMPEWTGRWEVTVLDAAGTILRTESFTVE
jgi:hypothetical protein